MGVLQISAEGGTDGIALTVANSGGAGDTAATSVTAGALVYGTAAAIHGTLGLEVVPSSGVLREGLWTIPDAGPTVHLRGYFRHTNTPTVTHTLLQLRPASGTGPQLQLSTTGGGRLNLQNAAAAAMFGAAASEIANGDAHRVEIKLTKGTGTTDGTAEFVVFDTDDTTELYHPAQLTNVDTGTADYTRLFLGRPSGTTTDVTAGEHWDSITVWTGADLPATMDNPWPVGNTLTQTVRRQATVAVLL